MSLWTCEECGKQDRHTNKGDHKRFKCPKQGNMLKALERQRMDAEHAAAVAANPELRFHSYLPCLCGCGERVGQVKGLRKKHYLNDEHYEAHRALQRRQMGTKATPEPMDEEEVSPKAERRLAEEVAPIRAREEETAREAARVPLVTGEASFLLWARCLGFSVDVGPVAA